MALPVQMEPTVPMMTIALMRPEEMEEVVQVLLEVQDLLEAKTVLPVLPVVLLQPTEQVVVEAVVVLEGKQ